MHYTSEEWKDIFEWCGCLWKHGEQSHMHAELNDGTHSDIYLNAWSLLERPRLVRQACEDLLVLTQQWVGKTIMVDRVIGPPASGWPIAAGLAYILNCRWAVARDRFIRPRPEELPKEKDATHPSTFPTPSQGASIEYGDLEAFTLSGSTITRSERVIVCDDVCVSGAALARTLWAVERAGAHAEMYLPVLVNIKAAHPQFPETKSLLNMRKIISLFDLSSQVWKPEECPLCKDGIPVVKPGSRGNY